MNGAHALLFSTCAVMFFSSPTLAYSQTAQDAITMFIFGQSDSTHITSKGLYGIGKADTLVHIQADRKCIYTLSSNDGSETIDFAQVAEIRITLRNDLGSDLKTAFAAALHSKRAGPIGKAVWIQILGTKTAVCSKSGCVNKRLFTFHDVDQIDRARRAAAYFREHFCPGRKF